MEFPMTHDQVTEDWLKSALSHHGETITIKELKSVKKRRRSHEQCVLDKSRYRWKRRKVIHQDNASRSRTKSHH